MQLFYIWGVVNILDEAVIKEVLKSMIIEKIKDGGLVLELTKRDIEKFKHCLTLIKDDSTPANKKREAAKFIKSMNDGLKRLHEITGEREFAIFYNYCIEGKTRNEIADALNIDISTVARNKEKALKKLSIILYPEINITNMM